MEERRSWGSACVPDARPGWITRLHRVWDSYPLPLRLALLVHLLAAAALMPVAGQPYDLAALTGASEAWLRWGVPLLNNWKFGYDLAIYGVAAQGVRFLLIHIGLSGAASIAIAWKAPLVAANIGTAGVLYNIGRRFDLKKPWVLPTAWLLSPVPLWVAAGHGQVEPLTAFAIALSLDLIFRRQFALAGLICGMGVGIEYVPIALLLPVVILFCLRVITWRQALAFASALIGALGCCFLPFIVTGEQNSLVGGLLSSAAAAVTHPNGHGFTSPSVSLWSLVPGLTPSGLWILIAGLVVGALTVHTLSRHRNVKDIFRSGDSPNPPTSDVEREVTFLLGSSLCAVLLLDPGPLPQFSQLLFLGLCFIALTRRLSLACIILGPVLQLSTELVFVYGGSFQSYWYDAWANNGRAGWSLPQSLTLDEWCARISLVVVGFGLILATSRNGSNTKSRERHAIILLCGAAASTIFLAIWSLQPVFWQSVGSTGPSTLPDVASFTAVQPAVRKKTSRGLNFVFPPGILHAASASHIRPSLQITGVTRPVLAETTATRALPLTNPTSKILLPEGLARSSGYWVVALVGAARWSASAHEFLGVPTLSAGGLSVHATSAELTSAGWLAVTYRVPRLRSSTGTIALSLSQTNTSYPALWDGGSRSRWVTIAPETATGFLRINASTYSFSIHLTAAEPPTNVSYWRTTIRTALPRAVSLQVVVPGTVSEAVSLALIYPLSAPLSATIGAPSLFLIGVGALAIPLVPLAFLLSRHLRSGRIIRE